MFSVCVGVMGEVWFSFFSYVSFHASVLYTCVSIHSMLLLEELVACCTVYTRVQVTNGYKIMRVNH